jgi:predicted nucleotidyltransferase
VSEELPQSRLEKIASLLLSEGVQFLVIGGQAEYLFGSSRVTHDVDICYARDRINLQKIAKCLRQLDATLRGVPDDVPFQLDERTLEMGNNFTFKTKCGALDILGHVEPLGDYNALLPHHEKYEVGPLILRTIGLDDLLTLKRHINRLKDQESIAQLLAIKRIRTEQNPA